MIFHTWIEGKVENLFEYASEGGTPSTANKSFYANEIPFVKIEDTNQKYILKTNSYISKLGLNNSSAWLIPKNNIIFTTGATIGNVSINKILTATKQGIVGAIIKKTFDLEYVYYLLSSNTFQENVRLNSSTGTFSSLALSTFLNLPVVILLNRFEQEKISTLFYTLDKIVSLYERKISVLEKLEKLSWWIYLWRKMKQNQALDLKISTINDLLKNLIKLSTLLEVHH
ncbi:restriction endonuclease subunit S [Mycoplasma sp. 1654_15]|uniref:restriction endonuclease subunit S n=1 Tax=Mycoplasma sp. 1654_15 TaxID=2725994 RepID=UPI00144974D0|nr:restriction endonuclease subunit S [Mycoplasma sp. 1654_15]QJB71231.1 hypothetical protein HF996_01910 [Mycoplasma sp. 1654_15]